MSGEPELMALPLAALPAAKELVQAVNNDLVVIDTKWYRKVKVGRATVLEPVDLQLHVNPVSLGIGAAGAALALGFAWIAWNGINPWIPGLSSNDYWKGVTAKLTRKTPPPKGSPIRRPPIIGPIRPPRIRPPLIVTTLPIERRYRPSATQK